MLQYSDANIVLQAILLTLRCASRSEKVTILGSDLFNDDPDLFRAVIHVSVYVCMCVCVCARLLFGKSYLACVIDKLQVSFAEHRLFYRALLQKRPTI